MKISKILLLQYSYQIFLLFNLYIKLTSSNKLELILTDIRELVYNSNDNKIIKSNLFQKLGQFYQYDCRNIIKKLGNKQNEEQFKINNFDDCLIQQSKFFTGKSRNMCLYCSLQSYLLAKEYFTNGNNKELIKESFSLLEYDYVDMLNNIGVLYGQYGNFEEANIIYEEALYHKPNSPSILTNLASNMVDINLTYTQELYDKALSLYENDVYYSQQINDASIVLYNYGVYLFKINNYEKAKLLWEKSYNLNNDMHLSLACLATLTCMKGSFNHIIEAKEQFQLAINKSFYLNDYDNFYRFLLQLKLAIPIISSSREEILITRNSFIKNALLLLNDDSLFNTIVDPIATSLGCSSLGYYMEYHGYEDLYVRQLHALIYWHMSRSALQYTAPFLIFTENNSHESNNHNNNLHRIIDNNTSRYYYKRILQISNKNVVNKIKIGFISAHFFHHSVGMLLRGVIKNIDRNMFDIYLITISQKLYQFDYLYKDLVNSVGIDKVVNLDGNIRKIQEQISSYQLDILVYGEIGMNSHIYFLSFATLARRSIVFWGHATTSGITAMSNISNYLNKSSSLYSDMNSLLTQEGPDYFVSSILFERSSGINSQKEYSERLILMNGMTTYFETPPSPMSAFELGISQINDNNNCPNKREFLLYLQPQLDEILPDNFILFGVPQSLYKLHCDFDEIVLSILSENLSNYVVFLSSSNVELTNIIYDRLLNSLGEVLIKQIIIVRFMSEREYLTLCALSDVILDPFPVGGGRSSLEIFSTGTPIVLLYPKTSILQLTYGMYITMGINNKDCCIAHTIKEYIKMALYIATNLKAQTLLRNEILKNNHKLYENKDVIDEWNKMLLFISSTPRPIAHSHKSINNITESHNDNFNWRFEEEKECLFTYKKEPIYLNDVGVYVGSLTSTNDELIKSTSFDNSWNNKLYQHISSELIDKNISILISVFDSKNSNISSMKENKEFQDININSTSKNDNNKNENIDKTIFISKNNIIFSAQFSDTNGYLENNNEVRLINMDIYENELNIWKEKCYNKILSIGEIDKLKIIFMCSLIGRGVDRIKSKLYQTFPIELSKADKDYNLNEELNKIKSYVYMDVNIFIGDEMKLLMDIIRKQLFQIMDEKNLTPNNFLSEKEIVSTLSEINKLVKQSFMNNDVQGSTNWVESRHNINKDFINWVQSKNNKLSHINGLDDVTTKCGKNIDFNIADLTLNSNHIESITIAITSSKRLHHFIITADSLLSVIENSDYLKIIIREIIVIDDNSSINDREIMKEKYPSFIFVFKDLNERGHANSMNKIIKLVKSRFLIYLEDDWLLFKKPSIHIDFFKSLQQIKYNYYDNFNTNLLKSSISAPIKDDHPFSWVIYACISILSEQKEEKIHQILFNSQISRECGIGREDCNIEKIHLGGWKREIFSNKPNNNHHFIRSSIPYSLHEFGLATSIDAYGDRIHDLSYWPGYSFNPGIWDLTIMKEMIYNCLDDNYNEKIKNNENSINVFDENDNLFEMRFSALGLASGGRMAYLHGIFFGHIGTDVSAYNINNISRPWDV